MAKRLSETPPSEQELQSLLETPLNKLTEAQKTTIHAEFAKARQAMHSEHEATKNELAATAHPSKWNPGQTKDIPADQPEAWEPSEIQKAEVIAVGTKKPVMSNPGEVSEKDFLFLWNRCVQMDKAMIEMIDHWRAMKDELAEANSLLKKKLERIEWLEEQRRDDDVMIRDLRKVVAELDDRVNWLET